MQARERAGAGHRDRRIERRCIRGAADGAIQATVSQRWDPLRHLIAAVLAEFVPHPDKVVGTGTLSYLLSSWTGSGMLQTRQITCPVVTTRS